MYEGWNALGYPFLDPVNSSAILSSIKGSYDVVKTYSDIGDEVYLNASDPMWPGKAYWVHMTDEALWAVSAYSLSDLENLFPRFGWIYENGSSGNVQNSLIAGCGFDSPDMGGLTIQSDLVKVSSTEFRNGYYGLYIHDSSPIISYNQIHDSRYAIVSERASPILSQNTIFSTTESAIVAREGFPIIASNDIYSNNGNGISLYNSTAILDSNTINSNGHAGVYIENASAVLTSQIMRDNNIGILGRNANITIGGSTLSSNEVGLQVSRSTINITSTDFSLEGFDIIVSNGTDGNIVGNTMSSSDRAHIVCESGSEPLIYGNIMISGDTGVLISSARPTVENNIIGQNVGSGIQIEGSQEVNVTGNTISGNGWAGVYLDRSSANIDGNSIYSNDFGIASFSSQPYIVNNTISTNRWYGSSFVYSNAIIENTHFIRNQWYGILSSYSTCEIRNSTIRNSTYQLYLTHDSRTDTINSTINEEKVHLDFTSVLYARYFVNIATRDTMGNMIGGVSYTITDRNGMTVSSGESRYGRAFYIPLISYIRTSSGTMDQYNPYTLSISWNGVENTTDFYVNDTTYLSFTFPAVNYSVEEDSGMSAIFDTDEWFPLLDNSTFQASSTFGVYCTVINGTVYVQPDTNWNGVATLAVYEMQDNETVWQYRFNLTVMAVNDPPEILGESPVYTSGEETTFTMTYRDVENQAPRFVRVVIDGKPHDMRPENSGDSNYVDGRVYVYSAHLSAGEHTYYFMVNDGENTVSTEETTVNVQYTMDLVAYGIYFLIIIGLIITVLVAYRIRKLRKGISPEDEDVVEAAGPSPLILKGSDIDKRRALHTADSGFDMPEQNRDVPRSTIDTSASVESNPAEPMPEHLPETAGTMAAAHAIDEQPDSSMEESAGALEDAPPRKEPRYGHSRYIEMTKKHRKMRVLVEDRDKYKLNPDAVEPEPEPEMEEDVDDILRSIKGD